MVIERQRLLVLDPADLAEFARADGEHTGGAERVGMAGAGVCRQGRASARSQQKANSSNETHIVPPTPPVRAFYPRTARLLQNTNLNINGALTD